MIRIFSIVAACLLIAFTVFVFTHKESTLSFLTDKKTITIKNGSGKGFDVVVPAHPQRVVFLNSSSLDLWLGMGGRDKVIACVKLETAPEGLYEKLNSNTLMLSKNANISMEEVLKQKPDLIIGSTPQQSLRETFNKAGIPVLSIENETLEDTYYEMMLYGQMNNCPNLAAQEIKRIKTSVESLQNGFKSKTKPKVALIWGTPTSFSLMTPSSRQGHILGLAGGENILKKESSLSHFMPISLEYIAKENPDYIFFVTMGDRKKMQASIDNVLNNNSSWQLLRAVKEQRVHVLPPKLFTSYYGMYVDESVKYMNKLLYPNN